MAREDAQGLFVELPHLGFSLGPVVSVGVALAQRVEHFGTGAVQAEDAFGLGDSAVGGVEQALRVGDAAAGIAPKPLMLPNRADATGLRLGILRRQPVLRLNGLGDGSRLLASRPLCLGERSFRLVGLALAKRQNVLKAESERFTGHRRKKRVERLSAALRGDGSPSCKPGATSPQRPATRRKDGPYISGALPFVARTADYADLRGAFEGARFCGGARARR